MRRSIAYCVPAGWAGLFLVVGLSTASARDATTFFEERIRPVLSASCYSCHAESRGKAKGGLQLDSAEAFALGADSGALVDTENWEASRLLHAIRRIDEDLAMPPDEALPAHVVADFETWVQLGAPYPESMVLTDIEGDWWDRVDESKLAPRDRPIEQVIDFYVDARMMDVGAKAAPPARPSTLVRRWTLDLNGRIPTPNEIEAFSNLDAPDRHAMWVDRLMDSPAFARFFANEFLFDLLGKGDKSFREFLVEAFEQDRAWDEIVRAMLLVHQDEEPVAGADQFLRSRIGDIDELATDASVAFFGVNISCARCHDHPLVPEWTQEHYYGMKSFFNRSFQNGDYIEERDYGKVDYQTTSGEKKVARLMFLTGAVVDEPEGAEPDGEERKRIKEELEALKKEKKPAPAPEFSRRAQLVDVGMRPGTDGFFSRAIVNRVWKKLVGRGFVEPADQMHGSNPPSHPELLLWLARDFSEHDYDVQRLVRGIALSRAYARSSAWGGEERPDSSLFAVGSVRPLVPTQYANTLAVATRGPGALDRDFALDEAFEETIEQIENTGRGWRSWYERPGENFQFSVDEALMLSNDARIDTDILNPGRSSLLKAIEATEDFDSRLDLVYRWVYGREATDEEASAVRAYVDRPDRDLEARWRQVIWATLTAPEARFNF